MITYKRKQKIKALGVLNKINEVCLLFARLPLRSETNSTDQYLKSNFGCLLSESQSSLPPPKNGTRVPNPLPHKEPKNSDYEFGIGQNAITEYKFEMWRKLKSKALKWFRLAKIQLEWQRQRQRQQSSTAANVLNNNNNRHFRRTPGEANPWSPAALDVVLIVARLLVTGYAVIWAPAPFTTPSPSWVHNFSAACNFNAILDLICNRKISQTNFSLSKVVPWWAAVALLLPPSLSLSLSLSLLLFLFLVPFWLLLLLHSLLVLARLLSANINSTAPWTRVRRV